VTVPSNPIYETYWERKRLLAGPLPRFPTVRWWETDGLSPAERVIFDALSNARSVLDVGAGDLRVRHKLVDAGFQGTYHTQDVGDEFDYTYADLADVERNYDVILCLDVLEHLSLERGVAMLKRLHDLLMPGGTLVIQTPNARCARHPLAWDMTHLHIYNAHDLWAYLTALGMVVHGYRVVFGRPPRGPISALRFAASAFVITRLIGADYADNLLLLARRATG
jgi:2-polyprenyl-3-methyl-5-hydroxy-6-metoxy-1,4-benzoquinol methylase